MHFSLTRFPRLFLLAALSLFASCDSDSASTNPQTQGSRDTLPSASMGTVDAPVFSPIGGAFLAIPRVTLTTATSGADIFYTTDGTIPTASSTRYTTPVQVGAGQTLKAIAVKSGSRSSVVISETYKISSAMLEKEIPWNAAISYGSLTHGGQTYKTVTIGTQTWMAENLNFRVDSSWHYNGNADSGARYGRLYTWTAAMNLPDSCDRKVCANLVQPRHQGVCPAGWHVPGNSEWSTLLATVGGESYAGTKFKSTNGWWDFDRPGYGTDTYGFRLLPGGFRYYNGTYEDIVSDAYLWSSSESDAASATRYNVNSGNTNMVARSLQKYLAYSVRCLKDSP